MKKLIKIGLDLRRKKLYRSKNLQSYNWRNQTKDAHKWLKRDMMPEKFSSVMDMLEEMVETRMRVRGTGREIEDVKCRVCERQNETVQHWLTGCTPLASTEYTERHNKTLMPVLVEWCREENLVQEGAKWYDFCWNRGTVLENGSRKIRWDYECYT